MEKPGTQFNFGTVEAKDMHRFEKDMDEVFKPYNVLICLARTLTVSSKGMEIGEMEGICYVKTS